MPGNHVQVAVGWSHGLLFHDPHTPLKRGREWTVPCIPSSPLLASLSDLAVPASWREISKPSNDTDFYNPLPSLVSFQPLDCTLRHDSPVLSPPRLTTQQWYPKFSVCSSSHAMGTVQSFSKIPTAMHRPSPSPLPSAPYVVAIRSSSMMHANMSR